MQHIGFASIIFFKCNNTKKEKNKEKEKAKCKNHTFTSALYHVVYAMQRSHHGFLEHRKVANLKTNTTPQSNKFMGGRGQIFRCGARGKAPRGKQYVQRGDTSPCKVGIDSPILACPKTKKMGFPTFSMFIIHLEGHNRSPIQEEKGYPNSSQFFLFIEV